VIHDLPEGQTQYDEKDAVGRSGLSVGLAAKSLPDGVPCEHRGCLHHVTHPCEGCGRIAGRSKNNDEPYGPDNELPGMWENADFMGGSYGS